MNGQITTQIVICIEVLLSALYGAVAAASSFNSSSWLTGPSFRRSSSL